MSSSRMRDRIKNRSKKNKNKATGVYLLPKEAKQFKPKATTYKLDAVPYRVTSDNNLEYKKGEFADSRDIFVHSNIGESKQQLICPKTIGRKCPVCEERQRLIEKDYDGNITMIKALKPQQRVAYNIIDTDNPKDGVQFFCTSFYNFTDLLLEEFCEDESAMDYAELVGGKTISVRFKAESFNGNEFVKVSKITFEDREDYDKSVLNKAIDLDNCFEVLDYKELKAIFLQIDNEPEIDEEEDEIEEPVVAPRRRAPVRKQRVVVEEPEEEEEEEEEEDLVYEEPEIEPEPVPVKKAVAKKVVAKKVVEEDNKGLKCPFAEKVFKDSGMKIKFGVDANKHTCCDECDEDTWNACCDLQELLNK